MRRRGPGQGDDRRKGLSGGSGVDYVFAYASLVGLREPLTAGGFAYPALEGRLRDFRRRWGAAMDNWDPVNDPKHWVVPGSGERPRVRVAYLDIEPVGEGGTVNGIAIPVDAARLETLDAREVNYRRVEVTDAFEPARTGGDSPAPPRRVFTYMATAAARARCRAGAAEANVCVSADYLAATRRAFAALGDAALAEFDRTTEPLAFPQADLELVTSLEGV